jgi:thiamine-phosphate pyrophosphorylase
VRLTDRRTERILLARLFPRAQLVTPNAHEAAALTGVRVRDPADAARAGKALLAAGCAAVLVKGGHLEEGAGTDVLVTAAGTATFAGRLDGRLSTHGTGCALAAAIAAHLARGAALSRAVATARTHLRQALRFAVAPGSGRVMPDPLWELEHARWQRIGRFHVITDEVLQTRFSHAELARLALAGGATTIQYREKRPLSRSARLSAATAVGLEIRRARGALIVNDDAALAEEVVADGVHVGAGDLPPRQARALVGRTALVGATANDLATACARGRTPVDYIGVGPVFATQSKARPAPALGLDGLSRIVEASRLPVVAIGGITPADVAAVLATGAHGIAVLGGVCCQRDPRAAAARYARELDRCLGDGWRRA